MERALEGSARPVHFAGGGQDSLRRVNLADALPAPPGLFLVERLVILELAERGDVHRLEELMIGLAHHALSAVVHVEFHALERGRDLYWIERLRLFRGQSEHSH